MAVRKINGGVGDGQCKMGVITTDACGRAHPPLSSHADRSAPYLRRAVDESWKLESGGARDSSGALRTLRHSMTVVCDHVVAPGQHPKRAWRHGV